MSPAGSGLSSRLASWDFVEPEPDTVPKCANKGCPCDTTDGGAYPSYCSARCQQRMPPCVARSHVRPLLKHGGFWAPDDTADCRACGCRLFVLRPKRHCRVCGGIFCHSCCHEKISLSDRYATDDENLACAACCMTLRMNRRACLSGTATHVVL